MTHRTNISRINTALQRALAIEEEEKEQNDEGQNMVPGTCIYVICILYITSARLLMF